MLVLFLHTIIIIPILSEVSVSKTHKTFYWKSIENIAERYPYVVGIVDVGKVYKCTGTVISKDAVLTSGSCLKQNPVFVVAAAAVIRHGCKNMGSGGILEIVHTVLHRDFIFHLEADDPFRTQIHSNIGIAIVEKPVLDLYFKSAEIGNFYATELREKRLTAVGYGKIEHVNTWALQEQDYRQTPCKNPKWYYCVCGLEADSVKKYVSTFGEGGPVIFDSQVVAVSNTPCGALEIPQSQVKYGIFTVIGPYIQWIEQNQHVIPNITFRTGTTKASCAKYNLPIKFLCIFFIFIKLLI